MTHFVRARDGSLYRNPVWTFHEGFICFDPVDPPELVLWLPPGATEKTRAQHNPVATLERVFGYGEQGGQMAAPNGRPIPRCSATVDSIGFVGRSQRVLPGTDPWEWSPAIFYRFKVVSRPPRPTLHDGSERHASRVRGACVIDWPSSPYDALSLSVPPVLPPLKS